MKTTVKIPKNRLVAPIDFGALFTSHSACGVKLSYTEFPFIQFDGNKTVLFDAFSAAHRYSPFGVDSGIIAFPFCFGCMTDGGERVAYCGLKFNDEFADEWKLLNADDVLPRLAVDQYAASVPITSGVCCLADESAYNLYRAHLNDDAHPLAGVIVLDGQTHTIVELYGKKYAVFSTGWGDGMYKCYAGLTSGGRVTSIIVDFGMIEYPKGDETPISVHVDTDDKLYFYDPNKSEWENNVARWSQILKVSKIPEERLQAYSRRGYAYHSVNNINAALSDYMAAVECSKRVGNREELLRAWSVFDNAAEIFCARSDYESAIKLMNDALSVNDSFYTGAFVRLIDLYLLTKSTDKAMKVAERMLEKRPDDPVAHMKYAECSVSAMDYRQAAKAFDTLAMKFKLYENLFDEASCLIELGEYEAGAAALERHPAKEQCEQYWYYKAYIDFKERRFKAALAHALTAYEIDREYMPALYLLIDIESVMQEYMAVARYAEEYKKIRPDNEYGYNVCAEAHLMLGNFTECAKNYCYLYERIKQNDRYAALAAIVSKKAGDQKRSREMLRALKRKHSEYYYGAFFGMFVPKFKDLDNSALDRVVFKLKSDHEFLELLAIFLIRSGYVAHADRIMSELFNIMKRPTFELVALQIRIADSTDDEKSFLTYFAYYVERFCSRNMLDTERRMLAERFMHSPQKHAQWLDEIAARKDSPTA